MNYRIILVFLFSGFVSTAVGDVVFTLDTQFIDKKLKVVVSGDRVNKSPRWSDASENPPISAKKAELLAREYALNRWGSGNASEQIQKSAQKWHLDSITLRPVGDERWIYVVQLTLRPNEALTGIFIPTHIVVLMDGSVVDPKEVRVKSFSPYE